MAKFLVTGGGSVQRSPSNGWTPTPETRAERFGPRKDSDSRGDGLGSPELGKRKLGVSADTRLTDGLAATIAATESRTAGVKLSA